MTYIRRAHERGHADFGWLQSKHTFSFGNYFDRRHMGVSNLRVINDDTVAAGKGFGAHGHRDMEIISYVLEGALEHEDNQGNKHVLRAGEIQRMTAGTGVVHSEYNASSSEEVKFLQIWLLPSDKDLSPEYAQKEVIQNGLITPLLSKDGSDGSIKMHANARLSRLLMTNKQNLELPLEDKHQGYLHVIKGSLELNGELLRAGDGASPILGNKVFVQAVDEELEALWFELAPKHS